MKSGGLAARYELSGESTILEDVDLEDLGTAESLSERFQSRRAERGKAVEQAMLCRRSRYCELGVSMEHSRQPCGGKHQWPVEGFTKQGRSCLDARNVGKHIRHDFVCREGRHVPLERHLVVRAAVDIVEDRTGKTAARQLA